MSTQIISSTNNLHYDTLCLDRATLEEFQWGHASEWLEQYRLEFLRDIPVAFDPDYSDKSTIYLRLLGYLWDSLRMAGSSNAVETQYHALKKKMAEWKQLNPIDALIKSVDIKIFVKAQLDLMNIPKDTLAYHRAITLDTISLCANMIGLLSQERDRSNLFSRTGGDAQNLIDLLQHLLDSFAFVASARNGLLKALLKVSQQSGILPRGIPKVALSIPNSHIIIENWGATSIVYEKSLSDGTKVAAKYLRLAKGEDFVNQSKSLRKVFIREIVIWHQLHHPNLNTFIGYAEMDWGGMFSFALWMTHGVVPDFLKANPNANRKLLAYDLTVAVEFLHSVRIVHGDIKPSNILVDENQRARLSDFGLACVLEDHEDVGDHGGGTKRYMAPEVMHEEGRLGKLILASDIYSVASTFYQVFTDRVPFHEILRDDIAMLTAADGGMPTKPETTEVNMIEEDIWQFMTECWSSVPERRPTASDLRVFMERVKQDS